MTPPLITVVLPVYNAAKYLHLAIESILTQTLEDFEFIIINDGSTDDSLTIINQYADKDNRIKVVSRVNKGLNYSLNEGISVAQGKYIARMDADDISLSDRFSKQSSLLDDISGDICGCHFWSIDEDGKKIDTTLVPLNDYSILINLAITAPFAHGSVMMRRSFLLEHSLFYGKRAYKTAEDYDLWVQMYDSNALFCNVDEFLFEYRDYDNSLSKSNGRTLKIDAKFLSKSMFDSRHAQINKAIDSLITQSLSDEEKNLVIACALYLCIYRKSYILRKVISIMPKKNLVTTGLKFLTGRFF